MSSQIRSKLRGLASAAVLVSAGLASSPSPASAANIIGVTAADDSIDPNDGVTSLREAFIIANSDGQDSIISLQPATIYTLSACLYGGVTHTDTNDLKIEGNTASIQQTCPDNRIITNKEPASTLTLRNLSLTKDGYPLTAMTGAAIWVDGPLQLLNVQIHDVHSGPAKGHGDSIVFGGDRFNAGRPDVQVVGGSYTRNSGDVFRQSGGGLAISGRANISGNQGFGVRLIDGSPVSITDSAFIGNTGGGVLTTGQGRTSLHITNSTIADNGGTGVTCSMCNDVSFDNVTVKNNGTDHAIRGGGVSITTNDHAKTQSFRFLKSRIEGNYSNRAGGGVRLEYFEASGFISSAPIAIFDNTVIAANQTGDAVDAQGSGADGGGIYAASFSVEIAGSVVEDNITSGFADGGGIHVHPSFHFPLVTNLTIADSEIAGNIASGDGGGISFHSEGVLLIKQSAISNNRAGKYGGGVYGHSPESVNIFVKQSLIDNNRAGTGGGIAVREFTTYSGNLTIDATTLTGNVASGAGGGLFLDTENYRGGPFTAWVENSTFTQNGASVGGGINGAVSAGVSLKHVTMTDNEAAIGAHINLDQAPLWTTASVFSSPLGGTNCVLPNGTKFSRDNFATDKSCDLSAADAVMLGLNATEQAALHEPLAYNGGFAPTRMPIASTPFGGIIPASHCKGLVDQLGASRPQGNGCEPGAVEIEHHTCLSPVSVPSWTKPTKLPVDFPTIPERPPLGGSGFDWKPLTPTLIPRCAR